MKKLLCVAFLLNGIIPTAFSQENYIELVVKDTVMLKPKAWVYTVTETPDYERVVDMMDTAIMVTKGKINVNSKGSPKTQKQSATQQVTVLATRFGGQPDGETGSNLTVTKQSNYNTQSTGFLFTNFDSLKRFVQSLSALKEVDGRLTKVIPNESEPAMTNLDSRILTIAKQRAENLAITSGRQLGVLLLITEDTSKSGGFYENFLENIFRYDLIGKGDGGWALLQNQLTVTRSLKVRFALR